jgi:integrase
MEEKIMTEEINPQIVQNECETFFTVNPALKNKIKINKIKFALSQTQRDELLRTAKEINPKHYCMIKLQLETGARIGEIVNLSIPQVNFQEKTIFIESHQDDRYLEGWHPKTVSGNRVVPITDVMMDELKGQILKRTKGYVFLSNKKKNEFTDKNRSFYENSIIRVINIYAKKSKSIGINIGSHCLRRTYASYLLHSGTPISEISKLLGHKSIKITMEYLYEITNIEALDKIRTIIDKMNN